MRQRHTVLAALILAGCTAGDSQRPPVTPSIPVTPVAPAAPTPPPPPAPPAPTPGSEQLGMIWVMVVERSGVCIRGATVQIMTGPSAGPSIEQDAECDAWSYSGGVEFHNLAPGVEVTIRATTPSGGVQEKAVSPSVGGYWGATLFDP
jgi:hypothetical protein